MAGEAYGEWVSIYQGLWTIVMEDGYYLRVNEEDGYKQGFGRAITWFNDGETTAFNEDATF